MTANFWSLARSSLVAIGLAASAATSSAAAPLAPVAIPLVADAAAQNVVPVSIRCRNHRCFERRGDFRLGRHDLRRDRHAWRHHRRHHRHFGNNYGPGIVLGFGLGLPAYHYYAQPRYRRHYPAHRISNAHVRWCYNRYISYRAYDNTFQPYGGPRRLCWSPYS